ADGKTYDYEYDVLGRRVKKSLTEGAALTEEISLLFDGDNAYQEYSSAGEKTAEYMFSGRIDEPLLMTKDGQEYTYHQNHLGTVMGLSGANENLVNEYGYTAYGMDRGSVVTVEQPYRYTARENIGDTGLYYNRSRIYNSSVGRFFKEDEIFYGANWYHYVKNNPLIYVDPYGFNDIRIATWDDYLFSGIAISSGFLEIVGGIGAVGSGIGAGLGVVMVTHGTLNMIDGFSDLYDYTRNHPDNGVGAFGQILDWFNTSEDLQYVSTFVDLGYDLFMLKPNASLQNLDNALQHCLSLANLSTIGDISSAVAGIRYFYDNYVKETEPEQPPATCVSYSETGSLGEYSESFTEISGTTVNNYSIDSGSSSGCDYGGCWTETYSIEATETITSFTKYENIYIEYYTKTGETCSDNTSWEQITTWTETQANTYSWTESETIFTLTVNREYTNFPDPEIGPLPPPEELPPKVDPTYVKLFNNL
ncbi:MAG TPA: hypothetical protein DC049_02750, partial [Spirochaetia bacterium]|nr:hypothetical protein [Spirochaetia bacterium]